MQASQVVLVVKSPPTNAGYSRRHRVERIPWRRGPLEVGSPGNPLQDSCWEDPMDRGAWQAYGSRGRKESDTTETI